MRNVNCSHAKYAWMWHKDKCGHSYKDKYGNNGHCCAGVALRIGHKHGAFNATQVGRGAAFVRARAFYKVCVEKLGQNVFCASAGHT